MDVCVCVRRAVGAALKAAAVQQADRVVVRVANDCVVRGAVDQLQNVDGLAHMQMGETLRRFCVTDVQFQA